MTEADWNACTDPIMMIEFLRGNPTSEETMSWWNPGWRLELAGKGKDRKFRLFACACCRRIWGHIPEQCNRDAVTAVEDYLEGRLAASALQEALYASSRVEWKADGSGRRSEPGYWIVKYLGRGFYKMTAGASALLVASQVIFMADEKYGSNARYEFTCCYYTGAGYFLRPFQWPLPIPADVETERATQATLLRCIFGPLPFRPVTLAPAWLTSTVQHLASAIYEERTVERLPILADVLEDAGCPSQDIIDHCRQPGGHVLGCWVLDLLLGKE